MTTFNLISPTNKQNYTMKDVVKKMKERSGVFMDRLEFRGFTDKCRYESRDALLVLENLRVTESLWCDSISFSISLKVPVHFTRKGKISFGVGTFDENVDNPYTTQAAEGSISVWLNDTEKETVTIDNSLLAENNNLFIELLNIAITTSIIQSQCLADDTDDVILI